MNNIIVGDIYTMNNIMFFSYKPKLENVLHMDIFVDLGKNTKFVLDLIAKELNISNKFKKQILIEKLQSIMTINNNQIIFKSLCLREITS